MVIIRLARSGAKKRPFYRIEVTDHRRPRDSNSIERIGHFNPIARGQEVRLHIETERLQYWLSVGAQMSDRVASLYKSHLKEGAQATAA